MLRKGRFDEIFFVDLPAQKTREEILRIHLEKKDRGDLADEFDLRLLQEHRPDFREPELEDVKDALFQAFDAGRELEQQDIASSLEATYPLSKTMRENILEMRKWAKPGARLASDDATEILPEITEEVPRLATERRNLLSRTGSK